MLQLRSSTGDIGRIGSRCRVQHAVTAPTCRTFRAQPRVQQQRKLLQQTIVRSGAESSVSSPTGAPEGQMSVELMAAMQAKIQEALEAERVVVSDVYGDGRHVNIDVVSTAFEGKNSVQRQRMVYKAIWLELQEAVHAVDSMSTKTPAEAAA